MPYCPQCRDEYREGIDKCAACGMLLVEELPEESLTPMEEMELRMKDGELVAVFMGDLEHCKERHRILEERGVPSLVTGDPEDVEQEQMVPTMYLLCAPEDLDDVSDVFNEVWNEQLEVEGLEGDEQVVDLEEEEVECPGCGEMVSELTADGECPECGLFLGLPDDEELEELEEYEEEDEE